MSNEVVVDLSGPLFRPGFPHAVLEAGIEHIKEAVAREGAEMVRQNLDTVLKHPTGYYRSHVQATGNLIQDGGVIYGPWLEGTGSRNRTSRFKGYWTFRRTTQQLQDRAGEIAERALVSYVRELN